MLPQISKFSFGDIFQPIPKAFGIASSVADNY